jgi:hypothetical protein
VRCLLVAALPLVTRWSVFGLYPVLYVLGGIEALVQPARQAALPALARSGRIGRANALVVGAMAPGQVAGFAAAGVALARLADPRPLYWVDAATFAVSALLVATLGELGGGVSGVRLRGGFARAWAIRAARPLLVVAGGVVFFIGMLNPALLPLAYVLSPGRGPSVYSLLEVCLTAGLFAGSAVAGRIGARLRLPALASAVSVFGAAILAVGFSTALAPAAAAIALSGAGNAVYAVMNQTALLEAASDSGAHGTVMAARFAINQSGKALGLASGAAVTAIAGARGGFAVIGAGLLAVAAVYTLHHLLTRATRRTPKNLGDPDAIAPAVREG